MWVLLVISGFALILDTSSNSQPHSYETDDLAETNSCNCMPSCCELNDCSICCYNTSCGTECNRCFGSTDGDNEFMLAAQVALGAAVVIAATALLSIVWKTCARRRSRRRREMQRNSFNLSTEAIFVIDRLRDRPPRYDDTNHFILEKPPSYQHCTDHEAMAQPPLNSTIIPGLTQPITLVGRNLTATHFIYPPPYSSVNGQLYSESTQQNSADHRIQLGEENNLGCTQVQTQQGENNIKSDENEGFT